MMQKEALPAVICYDCGHPAAEHRGKQWQSRSQCVGDEDGCTCTRRQENIERHAEQERAGQRAALRRLGFAMLAGLMMAFGSAIASILASNALAEQNRRDTNAAVCELLAYGASTEANKLQAYRLEPPPTAAGKAQAVEVARALQKYQNRQQALGCPPPKETP